MDAIAVTSAFFLLVAIASLWAWREVYLWAPLCLIATALAWWGGYLNWIGVAELALFTALVALYPRTASQWARVAVGLVIFALGCGILLALLPGVFKWRLTPFFTLSANSYPYRLSLNFAKPVVGVILIGLLFPTAQDLAQRLATWVRTCIPLWLAGLAIVGVIAYFTGFVTWAPKSPTISWMWGVKNLLFVALPEEALFRGFIQHQLTLKWGPWPAILIAALLFGGLHFWGGPIYMLLAAIAGIMYGWSYQRAGLEGAIVSHFLLNAVHFFLFSYPGLQSTS